MIILHLVQRYKNILLSMFLLGSIGIIAFFSFRPQPNSQNVTSVAPATNTSVNYTSTIRKLDPNAIGMDISGYGYPNVLVNDRLEQQKLKSLGIKYMRMDLKYSISGSPTSKIVCGGKGCDRRWTGDQWIQAIKSIGAEPVIIVPYNILDAVNMVKHFNKNTYNYVQYWLVGNEPDLEGIDASTYNNDFNQEFDAMKAVDPTIKIGGGTTAWSNTGFLQTFLQACGSRVDFVDFHGYAQKGDVPGETGPLFKIATGYGNDISNIRALIQKNVPARASHIDIEIGEWELDWGGNAQDNTNFHTLWTTSVIGHILSSGGRSLFYADKENALYSDHRVLTDTQKHIVNVNLDDTSPAYHGIGMFTGEGLFQGFGDTLVEASTTLPNVEIYASANPKDIILINKNLSTTATATIKLNGVTSAKADVWRKDEGVPFPKPPTHLKPLSVQNNIITYSMPPFSVTTLVVLDTSSQTSSTFISAPLSELPITTLSAIVLASKRKVWSSGKATKI